MSKRNFRQPPTSTSSRTSKITKFCVVVIIILTLLILPQYRLLLLINVLSDEKEINTNIIDVGKNEMMNNEKKMQQYFEELIQQHHEDQDRKIKALDSKVIEMEKHIFKNNDGDMSVLKKPNLSLPTMFFDGCCGIGHRLSRNIPVIVFANKHSRMVHALWNDLPWSKFFKDSDYVKMGSNPNEANRKRIALLDIEFFSNNYPPNWYIFSSDISGETNTVFDDYDVDIRGGIDVPEVQAVLASMRESLTPLVLSYLNPIREQQQQSDLKLCTHIREGNNELGDWEIKPWRHINLKSILISTHQSMVEYASTVGATNVTLFVASDNTDSRPWFESNVDTRWKVISPVKKIQKPENGVWFGEANSTTANMLSTKQQEEAMAEAIADVFALGECDALFIPNYSSFSFPGISLARAQKKLVFFRDMSGTSSFREMSQINNS